MSSWAVEGALIELVKAFPGDTVAVAAEASSSEAHGFILEESGLVVGSPAGAALHQCSVDIEAYDESLWTRLAIGKPGGMDKAVRKRLAEFLAGRYCVGRALHAIGLGGALIARGEGGCPVWPAGVSGSISHHGGVVVAAVTTARGVLGVGIDVQSIVPAATIHEIRSTILHGQDEALLAGFGGEEADQAFTLIFSIKEAFFKAAFPIVRRYFDFQAAEILELDLQTGRFRLRLCEDLGDHRLAQGMTYDGRFQVQGPHAMSLLVFGGRGE